MARILIADDDRDIRDLVSLKLVAAGYDVSVVADGAAAWNALLSDPPSLAILDIMMPGMSGLDVVRSARANPPTQDLLIMLLTARSRDIDVSEGYAAGADDYVLKPFSPRELVRRVQDLLSGSGASG